MMTVIDLSAIRAALRHRPEWSAAYRAEWYDKRSRRWLVHRRSRSQRTAVRRAESFCQILLDDVPYRVVNTRTGLIVWERYQRSGA